MCGTPCLDDALSAAPITRSSTLSPPHLSLALLYSLLEVNWKRQQGGGGQGALWGLLVPPLQRKGPLWVPDNTSSWSRPCIHICFDCLVNQGDINCYRIRLGYFPRDKGGQISKGGGRTRAHNQLDLIGSVGLRVMNNVYPHCCICVHPHEICELV